jgi:hypothetical protein
MSAGINMSIVPSKEGAMSSRKSRQVEVRMVAEYLKLEYSRYTHITKQPLGKVPEELMAEVGYKRAVGMTRPFRPEVDAVVVLPGALVIIEAKVWNVVNGCAKLPVYKSLIPFTPELAQYRHLPVIMELVVGWTNDNLEIMARDAGVRIKVYCPTWLNEVVQDSHKYWTSEYRAQREEKLKLRQFYDLD